MIPVLERELPRAPHVEGKSLILAKMMFGLIGMAERLGLVPLAEVECVLTLAEAEGIRFHFHISA